MRLRALKDFITKNGKLITKGDICDINGQGKRFYKALLDNHFAEEFKERDVSYFGNKPFYSRLTNLIIAGEDYVEGDKKHFTYDEAMDIQRSLPDGWRLPTRSEWALICEEFGQKDGRLDADTMINNLRLGRNGYVFNGSLDDAGSNGYYWSSTAYSASNAYSLGFNSSSVNPSSNRVRYYGFSVRCVRKVNDGKC